MSTLFPKKIPYVTHTKNDTAGRYDEAGDYVPGVESDPLYFYGSVQPASGQDFQSLPTGRETKGIVKVYSDRELPISRTGRMETGAIFTWRGKKYEVVAEGDYANTLIEHYKYLADFKEVVA